MCLRGSKVLSVLIVGLFIGANIISCISETIKDKHNQTIDTDVSNIFRRIESEDCHEIMESITTSSFVNDLQRDLKEYTYIIQNKIREYKNILGNNNIVWHRVQSNSRVSNDSGRNVSVIANQANILEQLSLKKQINEGSTGLRAQGGLNFTVTFINDNPYEIYDLGWYVDFIKDFGFFVEVKNFCGEVENIPPNNELKLFSLNFFGLGRLNTTFKCEYDFGGYPSGHGAVGLNLDLYIVGFFVIVNFIDWVFPWENLNCFKNSEIIFMQPNNTNLCYNLYQKKL